MISWYMAEYVNDSQFICYHDAKLTIVHVIWIFKDEYLEKGAYIADVLL